ncbi:hypothetical protein LCGC14_2685240 [marine sediment metagenome]|uniref:Uncharacterized protein n=1 Tax=marine sediment metagenome TaxID=412755 RepID=A0A0F8ZK61_9ZZZZ
MVIDTKDCYAAGKRVYNLPARFLSPRDLAEAYAYALNKWGDSTQSRYILDCIDKLATEDDVQGLKDHIEELDHEIECLERQGE